MIVYKLQNNVNGKTYIGITQNGLGRGGLNTRISSHLKNDSVIGHALRKYGLQSFTVSVIDVAEDRAALGEKEKYWIQFHNSRAPIGYNCTEGGDGLVNPSREMREKWSKARTGIGNPFYGKTHSEETKQKMSIKKIGTANALGHACSKEAKKIMSDLKKGKPSNRKGTHHSEESKQKMRKSHQKKEKIL